MGILNKEQRAYVEKARRGHHATWGEIGAKLGMTGEDVRSTFLQRDTAYIGESPFPVFDEPLRMEGDAVVLADVEFPYHNADFLNKVLALAEAWGVRQLILAGDVLHMSAISAWSAAWKAPTRGGLSEEQERAFVDFLTTLPAKAQAEGFSLLEGVGQAEPGEGMSEELGIARRELARLGSLFDRVDYVIGNHDDRLLRALDSPMFADELLRLLGLDAGKVWRIAPYYFSYLESAGEVYRIEHPNGTGRATALRLASKYLCHILMAHDHAQIIEKDQSGRYWAIHTGHCVDEERLAYAAQRSNARPAHNTGAVIVRGGYPFVLSPETPWDLYMHMRGDEPPLRTA